MKSFFFSELPREDAKAFFVHIRDDAREHLAQFPENREKLDRIESSGENREASLYWGMTLDYGVRYYEMLAEWAEECLKKLEE